MNYKKLLAPYLWRLRLEALLKSLLAGLIVGFAFGVVATVWCRIAIVERDILTMMLYSLYVALGVTPVAYLFYRPNVKKAAKRVDKTGLFDRTSTMLALRNDDSYIATVQREDAVERLKKVKASKIPFNITLKPVIAVFTALIMLCCASMLPYKTIRVEAEEIPEEIVQESRIIANLIAQLRTLIEEADVPEDIKNELHIIVNDLEASVDDYDTTLEKAAKISEARTKILAIIERVTSDTYKIGSILEEEELTAGLGKAIKNKDEEMLYAEIDELRNTMLSLTGEERKEWLLEVADKLYLAVEKAGGEVERGNGNEELIEMSLRTNRISLITLSTVTESSNNIDFENTDEILLLLTQLADTFSEAAAFYEDETVEDPDDISGGLGSIGLGDAAQGIIDKIMQDKELSEGLKDIIGAIEDARDELFGNDGEDEIIEDDESAEGNQGEGEESTEGTEGDENENIGGGVGGGENDDEDDDESFFDPGSMGGSFGDDDYELTEDDFDREIYEQIIVGGEVNYKDVYLDYYASALEAIARSEIPDDLKDVIINYFTSLE